MINTTKFKISSLRLNNIIDSSKLIRLLYMDTFEHNVITNNMLKSDTLLTASVTDEQARTPNIKQTKKKKKKTTNTYISSTGSPHSRPYTWFLAFPSKKNLNLFVYYYYFRISLENWEKLINFLYVSFTFQYRIQIFMRS